MQDWYILLRNSYELHSLIMTKENQPSWYNRFLAKLESQSDAEFLKGLKDSYVYALKTSQEMKQEIASKKNSKLLAWLPFLDDPDSLKETEQAVAKLYSQHAEKIADIIHYTENNGDLKEARRMFTNCFHTFRYETARIFNFDLK